VPIAVGRLIRQQAEASAITPSAAAAHLLEEATRMDVEHQHSALIEATIERVLHARLERVDIMAYKAARESFRSRWILARLLALLGDRMPAEPTKPAEERASRLNTESYRKASASLGQPEDAWQEPS